MENSRESLQAGQQGSGSAENTGQERHDQTQPLTNLSSAQKQDIADEIGEDADGVASIKDLGQWSGRDDASGGVNDGMEGSSTGEETDR